LIIVHVGILDTEGSVTFYRHLEKDDWSSSVFQANGPGQHEEMKIDCITIATLLSRYGVPYYMKIDVERADKLILGDIARLKAAMRIS
jgi:FkbM family methyltransferase